MATFNTELQRKGPGILLRDILRGEDPQIDAVIEVLKRVDPDIVVLQGFDYDLRGTALAALVNTLKDQGIAYPYSFAARPNTGMPTGLDMDGDGRRGDPRDAQGYGTFSGQGGMAILSRHPIVIDEVQDFTSMLWRDFPDAILPTFDDGPFPSAEAQAVQRLSTTAHWVVPVEVPDIGRIHLLTFHASPPVFDGPEDRNGRRNHDEIIFWDQFLNGDIGNAPEKKFLLLGVANLDPADSDGRREAIRTLLSHSRLQDPQPKSLGSTDATGDLHDTVDWDDPEPGNLRVDYVLPSTDWTVTDSGVHWPPPDQPGAETAATASRHRLVWVDVSPR